MIASGQFENSAGEQLGALGSRGEAKVAIISSMDYSTQSQRETS